jgi:hypothetical protein
MRRSIPDHIFNPSLEKCQQEIPGNPKAEIRRPKEIRTPKTGLTAT